jgi:hypothetical protein
MLGARQPRSLAVIDLSPADSLAQRLRSADIQLLRASGDRSVMNSEPVHWPDDESSVGQAFAAAFENHFAGVAPEPLDLGAARTDSRDRHRPHLGEHRLAALAVREFSPLPPIGSCVAEVIVKFALQRGLEHRLGQPGQQPTLPS